jgi:hypothetical protein
MRRQEMWIAQGRLLPALLHDAAAAGRADRLHRLGEVRIVVDGRGTLVEWCVCAPNWASLRLVMAWIAASRGPFTLRYFLSGWFEETFASAARARGRVDRIMAKSDMHLSRRAFVRRAMPRETTTPALLREVWRHGIASPDHSIDCVYDDVAGRFRVERVGQLSTIARLWGPAPFSYPCTNGGAYDRIVGEAYGEVARSRVPRFDHVYAAMAVPDGEPRWIPYQRVVLPHWVPSGRPAVAVVTEIAAVNIQIV